MSGIKRETIIRVILGICMIFVSIGMIYGKSKAGNADEKGRTYIEESEKTAKQKNTEKSRKDNTIKAQMTEAQQLSDTEAKGIAEAEAVEASIQPGQYPVMGISSIRAWQLVNYFKVHGSTYPAEVLAQGGAPDIETFAQMYYEEATAEGVRPEVAFAQAMKEFLSGCQNRSAGTDPASESLCDRRSTCRGMCR